MNKSTTQQESKEVYLISFTFALSAILCVTTCFIYVRSYFSRGRTNNKLTYIPYKYLMIFTFLLMLQISIAEEVYIRQSNNEDSQSKTSEFVIIFVNVQKFNTEIMVIAYQTYEWFALWFMMHFQKGYDIYTVGVELRKFKPMEKKHWLYFKSYLVFQMCMTVIIVMGPMLY